jgi:hypothetical protein
MIPPRLGRARDPARIKDQMNIRYRHERYYSNPCRLRLAKPDAPLVPPLSLVLPCPV